MYLGRALTQAHPCFAACRNQILVCETPPDLSQTPFSFLPTTFYFLVKLSVKSQRMLGQLFQVGLFDQAFGKQKSNFRLSSGRILTLYPFVRYQCWQCLYMQPCMLKGDNEQAALMSTVLYLTRRMVSFPPAAKYPHPDFLPLVSCDMLRLQNLSGQADLYSFLCCDLDNLRI